MIGWFQDNLADAEAYFAEERHESRAWDALNNESPDFAKNRVAMMAYNRLYYSKEFILPTYAEASVDDLVVLIKAQAEMAYYLALHLPSEDRRKGLQAQAVTKAGVVKEEYDEARLYDTPIPPFVRDLLCAYSSAAPGREFGAVDLCRDENKSVEEKVCNFDYDID